MTADIATQRKSTAPSTLSHTLTLVFAAVTLFFALLSIILGNRISSLQTNSLKAEKETAASEAIQVQEIKTKLQTATANLEAAQQMLDKEKAGTERLRRQLSVATKDLAKAQVDLASANQVITTLKSTVSDVPTLPAESPESVETQLTDPSTGTALSPEPTAIKPE